MQPFNCWARQLKGFGQVLKCADKPMMGKGLTQSLKETQKSVDKRTRMEKTHKGRAWDADGSPSGWPAEGCSGAGAWARRERLTLQHQADRELRRPQSWSELAGGSGSPPTQAPA